MEPRLRADGTATDIQDVDDLRRRVRLFLQVMLTVDLIAYVSDVVSPLVVDGLVMPDYPPSVLAWRIGSTAVLAAAWTVVRFSRAERRALVAIESGVTLWLTVVYIRVAVTHMHGEVAAFAPVFAMFGLMLLLSVRAALVPSPVVRTVAIGVACMGALFLMARAAVAALQPLVLDGLTFIAGAFVVATGVTSHVIYGLRREVRAAQRLGQYTLEEQLGEGGMGTVFRARHALLRRRAAIKLVRPAGDLGAADRATALQRFEREANATAGLRSPHTIELYDFGIAADGAFYYVMELLDGITLDAAVTRFGPMPPARVVHLLLQACDSLEEAHAAGLVHRDIKPANLFVCRYGLRDDFVKVLDFGLVAAAPDRASTDARLTADHVTAGTPAYLAPESVTRPDQVDGRADIYGLGGVAYWLLTGRPPFERPTAMATILAHVNDAPVPPSAVAGTAVPPGLEELVLDCLAKDPAHRPASAGALAARLRQLFVGTWSQADAARWWAAHPPAASAGPSAPAGEATVTVVRA